MTTPPTDPAPESPREPGETYDVVLLIEEPLGPLDARQLRDLHAGLPADLHERVVYHLLLPVDDAALSVEGALGGMGGMGGVTGGDVLSPPGMALDADDLARLEDNLVAQARVALDESVQRLRSLGGDATGEVVTADPLDSLVLTARRVDADEVIVLTRSHVVAEFFHVDWTSRARRRLGVPVLHLLEHELEAEQGEGGGEGVTGL